MKQPHRNKKGAGEVVSVSPSSTSSASSQQQQQQHRNSNKALPSFDDETSASSATTSDVTVVERKPNTPMEESIKNPWNSRWTDILVFTFVLCGFASLSIFVGVAAGISISIYYFEGLESDHRRLLMGYYGLPGYNIRQTLMTHCDTSIAVSHGDTVLTTTAEGGAVLYPVVQESPIHSTRDDDRSYPPPNLHWEDFRTRQPRPCGTDPTVVGYRSYAELQQALRDVNRYSAERYDRWTEYLERSSDDFVYQEEITLTICPNTILRGLYGPLFVNTESLTITCDGCTLSSWGSHISFGPAARNVHIVGLTFQHATASSMSFPYDGAEVTLEDCRWKNNSSRRLHQGSVLDMISSSRVNFFRCFVSQPRSGWGRRYQTTALSILPK